jgi:hypothetical protein
MTEAFDYQDDVRNKYADRPVRFVHIYKVLKDRNEQIIFIEMMKETARKLNSPNRLIYYHQLLQPLLKDDEKRFRAWLHEKERYGKDIQDRLKKQKESISIRWEL